MLIQTMNCPKRRNISAARERRSPDRQTRNILIVLSVIGLILSVTAYGGDSTASPTSPQDDKPQADKAPAPIPKSTADQPVSDPQKQDTAEPVSPKESTAEALPEIVKYISEHPKYGKIISAEAVGISREIKDQRVYTGAGTYTFYVSDKRVVGIKDENPKPEVDSNNNSSVAGSKDQTPKPEVSPKPSAPKAPAPQQGKAKAHKPTRNYRGAPAQRRTVKAYKAAHHYTLW